MIPKLGFVNNIFLCIFVRFIIQVEMDVVRLTRFTLVLAPRYLQILVEYLMVELDPDNTGITKDRLRGYKCILASCA